MNAFVSPMLARKLIIILFGAVLCAASSANTNYRLKRCAQVNDGIALEFAGSNRTVRRIALSPRGVELSGDVKGGAPLAHVKELVLTPVFKIGYVTGDVVQFGAIDAPCQKLLQKVAGLLMHVRNTEVDPKR